MPRMAGLVFFLGLLLAAPLFADDTAAEVADQIANLGSSQWSVREKAQRRLVAIGEPAREKLRAALDHNDLEVRSRASAALIEIGESFAYALQCAKEKEQGRREHGRDALKNLFRLDKNDTLARVNLDEMNRYGGYGRRRDSSFSLSCPPELAIASAEAMTGFPVFVAAPARSAWQTLMQATSVSLDFSNGIDQLHIVAAQINEMMIRALGNQGPSSGARTCALPMRIGQFNFILVTTVASATDPAGSAADQLLADFVAGGLPGVRAARLLAAGLIGDPAASQRLLAEFTLNPVDTLLAMVALHCEPEGNTRVLVAKAVRGQLPTLLASRDWVALEVAARALALIDPAERAAVLEPILLSSNDSLPFVAALWCARGGALSAEARARVAKCVNSRQDGIASCAARWFAGAKTVSDEELALVWKAAEAMPAGSAFFKEALLLIGRKDVSPRLVLRAREALGRNFETQLALAATVLRGNAAEADLALVVEKLWNLQNNALVGRLCQLFENASELSETPFKKLCEGLCDNDANRRRRFLRALRKCAPTLREKLIAAAETKLDALAAQEAAGIPKRSARLALLGLKAGAGDAKALEGLLSVAAGNEAADIAKAAAAALVDALNAEGLSQTLHALKKRNAAKFNEVATAAHLEQCRRAVEDDDSEAFRAAESRVNSLQARGWNWQLMQELQMLAAELSTSNESDLTRLLPQFPRLNALTVDSN